MLTEELTSAPSSDIDPFTDEALVDPWALYHSLRELGPVVQLPQYGISAVMRFDDVRAVLEDWQTFSSMGVGLNPIFNQVAGEKADTNLLMASPPHHQVLRQVLGADLSPRALHGKVAEFIKERADRVVTEVVARGSFDAVTDLARPFVMSVIYDLNGLPEAGRDRFFGWANAMFDALGPMNARTQQGLGGIGEMFGWLATEAGADQVVADSWTAHIYDAVASGEIPAPTAHELLSTYIAPALDTSTHAVSWGIQLFAEHPEQWDLLRERRDLIPQAYREILRIQPPLHHFGRRVERDTEIGGVPVAEGTQLMVSFGSANRDERRWGNPDDFDITRENADQLAWGYGEHGCIGQGVARLEGHNILEALADRVTRFEVGEGVPALNNLIHGLDSLPVTVS
jgi:cytochrome P450